MDIAILSQTSNGDRVSFEMVCGTKEAYISYNASLGMVNVLCKNASHRAWRGVGKTFTSWSEAMDAYKSPEMRAMIALASEN